MDDSWASTNISRIMSFDKDDFEEDFISTGASRLKCDDLEPFFEEDEMTPREKFSFQPFDDPIADAMSDSGWSEPSRSNHSPRYVAPLRNEFEPIEDRVLKCLSIQVLTLAHDSWELSRVASDDIIFDIDKEASAPNISDVEELFTIIHTRLKIEYEIALISLVYIKRLCKDASISLEPSSPAGAAENLKLKMSPYNWRAIMIICVRLATKVWDDYHVLNRVFAEPFLEIMDIKLLAALEIRTLQALGFELHVSESEFQNLHSVVKAHYSCLARGDGVESVLETAQSGGIMVDRLSPPPPGAPLPLTAAGATESAGTAAFNRREKFSKGWSWKRSRSNRVLAVDDEGVGATESDIASETSSPSKSPSKGGAEGGGGGGMRALLGRTGSNRVVAQSEPGS
jgi:hypothetical protein